MTPEESIGYLENLILIESGKPLSSGKVPHIIALRNGINALSKQIPKNPKKRKAFTGHKLYVCPSCKHAVLWGDAIPDEFDLFCGHCGQALLWESEETKCQEI